MTVMMTKCSAKTAIVAVLLSGLALCAPHAVAPSTVTNVDSQTCGVGATIERPDSHATDFDLRPQVFARAPTYAVPADGNTLRNAANRGYNGFSRLMSSDVDGANRIIMDMFHQGPDPERARYQRDWITPKHIDRDWEVQLIVSADWRIASIAQALESLPGIDRRADDVAQFFDPRKQQAGRPSGPNVCLEQWQKKNYLPSGGRLGMMQEVSIDFWRLLLAKRWMRSADPTPAHFGQVQKHIQCPRRCYHCQ